MNIRSLRNKLPILQKFLHDTVVSHCKNDEIDVVCLNETWLNEEEISFLDFQGYVPVTFFCRDFKTGGGNLIFVRNNIRVTPITWLNKMSVEGHFEICGVKIPKNSKYYKNLIILSVYRPPAGNISIFLDKLEIVLHNFDKENVDLVLTGDFNIDLLTEKNPTKLFLELTDAFDLFFLNKDPTRRDKNTSTNIDNCFTNIETDLVRHQLIDNTMSDHDAILIQYQTAKLTLKPPMFVEKRIINDEKLNQIYADLEKEDWHDVLNTSDVDVAFNFFFKTFSAVINKYCPLKRYKQNLSSKNKPFWNDELAKFKLELNEISDLKDSLDKSKRSQYNEFLKKYNKKIREAKIKFNESEIDSCNNKIKAFWDFFHRNRKIKTVKDNFVNIELLIPPSNNTTSNPNLIANELNKVFSAYDPPSSSLVSDYPWLLPENDKTFFFNPVTQDEIIQTISDLNNTYSAGTDQVQTQFIKASKNAISVPLCHIFNLSIENNYYPASFKINKTIPLHKKGDKTNPANYRGLNITSNIGKILDNLFKSRLNSFLKDSNLISEHQHGFTLGKSTDTASSSILNFIQSKTHNKNYVLINFLDISRAFDSVPHSLLLHKLDKLGFRSGTNDWLKSYFENREQVVEINYYNSTDFTKKKIQSSPTPILAGTFQGTTLGPNFFNLSVNDLYYNFENNENFLIINGSDPDKNCDVPSDANLQGFADDNALGNAHPDLEKLFEIANNNLNLVHKWFKDNHLPINKGKTKYMLFPPNLKGEVSHNFTLSLDSEIIEQVTEFKYLGIMIDNYLNWKSHITLLSQKLKSCIYLLRMVRNEFSVKYLLTLYFAYFYSNLKYGILFYGQINIRPILLLQKRCLRIIFRKGKMESCRPIFKDQNLLTVIGLYILERCCYIYNNPSLYRKNIEIHDHNTRNKFNIHISSKCSNIHYQDALLFNKLPIELRNLTSLKKFKTNLKKILLNNPVYTIKEYRDLELSKFL